MGGKSKESCGRCSVTTVLDATEESEDGGDSGGKNPFDGERIEVDESEMRTTVPHEFAVRRVKDRLDGIVSRLTWGTNVK